MTNKTKLNILKEHIGEIAYAQWLNNIDYELEICLNCDLEKAVSGSFSWGLSPEGHSYWLNIALSLRGKEWKLMTPMDYVLEELNG